MQCQILCNFQQVMDSSVESYADLPNSDRFSVQYKVVLVHPLPREPFKCWEACRLAVLDTSI